MPHKKGEMKMYRQEHPKPQFVRAAWENLNGKWQFETDHGKSGEARALHKEDACFSGEIEVPFCPESKLSGVGYTDFLSSVWYKRSFQIDKKALDGIVVLHFGAVDYKAIVYINGEKVGEHKGGYVSFSFDVTKYLRVGENVLTLQAEDDTRDRLIPSGKQSHGYESFGCFYTRTTGIWQTVWLEFMPKTHIRSVKYYPDIASCAVTVVADVVGMGELKVKTSYEGRPMGEASAKSQGGSVTLHIPLQEKHLWEVGQGRLYDVTLTYGEDEVTSYFGLRSVRLDGYRFLINEKSVFQRLVLDQGFYPDGIYTAPSDEELQADIERSIAMGFNGARLHEKVFEERFLYHCDKKGYIVWGEYPNWGLDVSYADSVYGILPEWLEEIERDFNHPSVIGWCPFNETWDQAGRKQCDDVLRLVYLATKAADKTRPCIDTSGNYHVITDIFDVHDYEQNPTVFKESYDKLFTEGVLTDRFSSRQTYRGEPTFVSEYGGIRWSEDVSGWGYGNAPKTEEEFLARLQGLTEALIDNPKMFGLCYTQLTDVEQEQNGLYTYDRKAKFPPEKIRPIFAKKAAIEEE